MAEVRLSHVTKRFRTGPPVLKDVDLTFPDGALVTLVGPSGCGKSTILNLIAGFERPSSGEVLFDGAVVSDRSPKDRGVAMVFQSYALYPHFDVRRNIAFPLEVAGLDRAEIERRVRAMATRLELEPLLKRKPKELSGGQRQRVALGRALVRKTHLCLFDEPLSNLDVILRGHMRAEIKKLHEERQATFIYVTHDQAEAMTLADQVVVLSAGVVQQVAPPRELYQKPENTFVATFIGMPRINLVRRGTLRVPESIAPKEDVIVGLRPEDLTVSSGPRPERGIAGRVWVVEPMGSQTWVTVDTGGEHVIGRAPTDFAARSGSVVWLSYDPAALLFFDRKTERRIDRS